MIGSSAEVSGLGLYILIWSLLICCYGAPSIVAMIRRSRRVLFVVVLNALLAWTIIGWFLALWLAIQPDGDVEDEGVE